MNKLINSYATSAYHIMTGVKRLDKVCNTTVLTSVSRNELIQTVHASFDPRRMWSFLEEIGAVTPPPQKREKDHVTYLTFALLQVVDGQVAILGADTDTTRVTAVAHRTEPDTTVSDSD